MLVTSRIISTNSDHSSAAWEIKVLGRWLMGILDAKFFLMSNPQQQQKQWKSEKHGVDTKKSVLGVKNSKTAIWLNHHITASSASVFEKNKLFGKDFLFPTLDWIDFQCFCRVNLWDKKTYNHILCPRKLAKYIPSALNMAFTWGSCINKKWKKHILWWCYTFAVFCCNQYIWWIW